jgi:hypothetical protein
MNSSPLYGTFMKLKRADFHLQSLQAAMKGFVDGNPYDTWDDPTEPKPPYIESFIIRAKEKQRPPREEWGAMIGDVVHNLRSALDHLVWELTKWHQGGEPSPPIPSSWRKIGFPIYKTDNAESHGKIEAMLWGIEPSLKTSFEQLQPFTIAEPEDHPLWLLHDLWNIDKHRHVHIAVVQTELQSVGYLAAGKGVFELTKGREAELADNAELLRVHRSEAVSNLPGMYLQLRGGVHIRFGPGSPAEGLSVLETLDRLYGLVISILTGFDKEFR